MRKRGLSRCFYDVAMNHIDARLNLSAPRLAAVFWLFVASAMCAAMLGARMIYMHSFGYRFLLWNLFLAWIPLMVALFAERAKGLMVVACGAVWLLFLPNAPYLLTDLVHLSGHETNWVWYDLIMLLSFGLTGLLLGYVSLYAMQKLVTRRFGTAVGWVFAVGTLALTSFGIYLGRIERFNSWDVLFNPFDLLLTIWLRIRHPFDYPWTYALSAMLSALLVAVYIGLYSFSHSMREPALQHHG